jgi:cytochrome c oxidase cbb3-type subunit 3
VPKPEDVERESGIETTGHEWDGIVEYDKPLPRWWLWVLYATIIWAVGYWIAMPAFPLISSFTGGVLGYSQRQTVADQLAKAEGARAVYAERLESAALEEARTDPELLRFALAGGRSAFLVNCSQCHGTGAAGGKGYPNLNDDDWLWGGSLEAIHATISYGIRSDHEETRQNQMPAFLAHEMLGGEEIGDVAEFVLSLSGQGSDAAAAERGAGVFADWCAVCHGEGGEGIAELGSPDLADSIWLYGGDVETVVQTISYSRAGVMPAWAGRLSPPTIKQLAIYVHSLGGGE